MRSWTVLLSSMHPTQNKLKRNPAERYALSGTLAEAMIIVTKTSRIWSTAKRGTADARMTTPVMYPATVMTARTIESSSPECPHCERGHHQRIQAAEPEQYCPI